MEQPRWKKLTRKPIFLPACESVPSRSFLRAASKLGLEAEAAAREKKALRRERPGRGARGERLRAIRPRVSWQTLWLTDVPLRGRIPRSHACATRHIPLSFTFFPAVSLLLGILSTLTRQQPPLAQRRRASTGPYPATFLSLPPPNPLLRPSHPTIHQLLAAAAVAAAAAAAAPLPRPPPAGFSASFLLFAFHASSLLLFVFFRRVYPTSLTSLARPLRSMILLPNWSSPRFVQVGTVFHSPLFSNLSFPFLRRYTFVYLFSIWRSLIRSSIESCLRRGSK